MSTEGAVRQARLQRRDTSRKILDESGVEGTATRARLYLNADSIQHADRDVLMEVQSILRHGSDFGFWETPREWAPAQYGRATLRIDLKGRIASFLRKGIRNPPTTECLAGDAIGLEDSERLTQILDEAVLVVTRYLILLRIGPVGWRKRLNSSLDPTTIRDHAYNTLPRLFAGCISSMISRDSLQATDAPLDFLGHLPTGFVDSLAKSAKNATFTELQRMFLLTSKGLWNHVPVLEHNVRQTTRVAGSAMPKPSQDLRSPHLPLPDDYVATMGARSLWLTEVLGPMIIPALHAIKKIYDGEDSPELTPVAVQIQRRVKIDEFLSQYVWIDGEGNRIEELPFPLYSPSRAQWSRRRSRKMTATSVVGESNSCRLEWPPANASELFSLANAVQLAHLFIVGMTLAGRRGEILSLERDCVRNARNGRKYANGKTFKLVQRHEGEWRDWVLPETASAAIEQQVRLISVLETIGHLKQKRGAVSREVDKAPRKHLWCSGGTGDRAEPLKDLNAALKLYARMLFLDLHPGGQSLRTHRFRKTVARLVALALTQAPKILMNVLGHKSIEMTMTYILTDKGLRAEIEQVCRELRIMRATEIVQKMVDSEDTQSTSLLDGGFGGGRGNCGRTGGCGA